MKIISILCPTRERVVLAQRYYESLVATAEFPEYIEVMFYVDKDDPQLREYEKYFLQLEIAGNEGIAVGTSVGPAAGVSSAWNSLAEDSQGDILLMGNDDLVAKTVGWDTALRSAADQYNDDIYCIFFDDGINHGRHNAFPAVSRKWYNTLGYFAPAHIGFRFFYNDTWIFDLGKRIDRVHYIPEVLIEHQHFTRTRIKDATTRRNRDDVGGRFLQHDKSLFEKRVSEREQDAKKLLRTLGNWRIQCG